MSHALRAVSAAALAFLSFAAHAQVYKCAQANGATTYQATPCPSGGKPAAHPTASDLNALQQAQAAQAAAAARNSDDPYAAPLNSRPRAAGPQTLEVPPPPRRAVTADNASDEDRRRACVIALNNVTVLNRGNRVYTVDSGGNPHFIADSDRSQAKARSEQQAAATCK